MREATLSYTRADGGWSTSVGLYLHCYPLNSVQALHLHIVDLAAVGPSYKHLSHKNLSSWTPSSKSSCEEPELARLSGVGLGPSRARSVLRRRRHARGYAVVRAPRRPVAGRALAAPAVRAGRAAAGRTPPCGLRAVWRAPRRRRRSQPSTSAAALGYVCSELARGARRAGLSYGEAGRRRARAAADRRGRPGGGRRVGVAQPGGASRFHC